MKKVLSVLAGLLMVIQLQAQTNITFRSNLTYPNAALSNIGGFVDSQGNEYALVGYEFGLSIVNVTDPVNPFIAFDVPGTQSIWREVKTWQNYAYVTTEGCCNGLQIINMSYLPDSIQTRTWKGSGAIANQLNTIHSLHIDDAHVYLHGSNLFNGATVIANLNDPWNPVYEGHTPGTYVHDGYVRNDVLYSGHIYDGYFSVFDVSNKSNPVLLATQNTPTNFTHNTWLNDAGTVLFTTDENSSSYLASYDITDLNNIRELDRIQITPGSGSVVHNTHTLNDYQVVSWYTDGVVIVDNARPDNLIITGHYDTYTQGSGSGFNGAWGVYPFLPSGNILVSDIQNGLFVLTPTYVRGCYLEGLVTDSTTGFPLNNVQVTILGPSISKLSKLNGEYKTGLAAAGTYDVQFSKAGYFTKVISGVNLQNGLLTTLNVQLSTVVPVVTISGTVLETGTNAPIADAVINFNGSLSTNTTTTDAAGGFTVQGFFPGNYTVTLGHWGHITACLSSQNITGGTLNYNLDKGYYDDFSLDFNWTVSGPSGNAWERGDPVSTTTQNGQTANPGNDVASDCGAECYVTDNDGGGAWDNDVDQGNTILTSPAFDATQYSNPHVRYYRWFYNGGLTNGAPDDSMKIFLTDGINTVLIESIGPNSSSSQWNQVTYRIADYMTPTASMRLIVDVGDPGPVFNIVEGGLDKFEVVEVTGISEGQSSAYGLSASPNPFEGQTMVRFSGLEGQSAQLQVFDMSGRLVQQKAVWPGMPGIWVGEGLPAGFYTARLMDEAGASAFIRLVKQ